ncbi:MAG: hypothetical protein JW786_13245 [Desulfobacterales bacterium]|nr:hypothetical protein [Desulfobacterales bacterium]
MYEIKTDLKKNRLYLIFGEMDRAEVQQAVKEIEEACKTLIHGFTCLTVLRKEQGVKQQDDDLIYEAQEIVTRYGVSKVVRVLSNENAFVQRQLDVLIVKPEYHVEYKDSIEEAEKILDGDVS